MCVNGLKREDTMKSRAVEGDWVRIHSVVLKPGERAEHLPEDTKKVPLEMWNKGFLVLPEFRESAVVGDEVEVKTLTGRKISGTLVEIHPAYTHSFGSYVPEIASAGNKLVSLFRSRKGGMK